MSVWTPETRSAAVDSVLTRAPVVPVIQISALEQALPLARSLLEAGLPVLEITLRSSVAIAAIRLIAAELPEACVGAGTIVNRDDLDAVIIAGASFAISPGCSEALYDAAEQARIPLIPGIATASELMRGMERGHRRFKFFPASSSGGIPALKAFAGPFPQVRFCPTGGISPETARDWLSLPNVITVGGSWMLPADAIARGDWAQITRLARGAATLVA